MPLFPGFVGPTYTSQSPIADDEECWNWYVENIESPYGKARTALYPTPGLTSFASSPLSPYRAMYAQDGRAFCVIGFGVFEIASNGVLTQLGTLNTVDARPATMCGNGANGGNQIFITSGGGGYILDIIALTLAQVSDLIADVGAFLDGFFIALNIADSQIRISAYLDGTTWDPTQFRARSAGSDNWNGMIVVHREIWLMGTQTYEVWTNTGAFPFPFAPIPGIFFNEGTGATFSICQVGESVAWLKSNNQGAGMVMLASQYAPTRISNSAVEYALGTYLRDGIDLSDAVSMVYEEDGHVFLSITFSAADATWVYDITTKMWHRRGLWDLNSGAIAQFTAWRPMYHCYAFGKHLVGDRATGVMYEMGIDQFRDAGDALIRRVRVTPHLFNENKYLIYDRLQLDMQVGVGLSSGQGVNPLVMAQMSKDGGLTYGNERQVSAGAMGKYKTRVMWNRWGISRDTVFKISVSDPVPWRIVNAYLEFRPGTR